ncbi:hypothetical protein [Bradyrhizobium sp. ORS 111]|uniref:hypothetical protein n=1 Tax=Bradyrhizobium sp. ORS 111 TaxID=1685958 RepID=UPI00388D014C
MTDLLSVVRNEGISTQPCSFEQANQRLDHSFKARLQVRCQLALPSAVEKAASCQLMTASEYVRRSVIMRLKADGVDLSELLGAA